MYKVDDITGLAMYSERRNLIFQRKYSKDILKLCRENQEKLGR